MALWKAGEEVEIKSWNLDHGIVEGKGGSLNKEFDFRSWHCGRQGEENLNKELEFRSWHCGRQEGGGSLNKELDFRSWHCGRQAN